MVTAQADRLVLKGNNTATLLIHVSVKDGYHIQANPISNESLVPVSVNLIAGNIEAGKAVYPAPKRMRLEGSDEWLEVLDGSFQVAIPVKAPGNAKKGSYTLNAAIRYQACDLKRCFFPRTITLSIPYLIN